MYYLTLYFMLEYSQLTMLWSFQMQYILYYIIMLYYKTLKYKYIKIKIFYKTILLKIKNIYLT